MVKVIDCLKSIEQVVRLEREEESFQPKLRVRRQYNPNDINIAKLFLAIREHRTGNPELNKISEIKGLLTQVGNINDIDLNDGGNTPLHVAVSKEHQDIVELLLNASGIDINIQNNQGNTPLHIAISKGNEELVRLLLSKGAKINIKNKDDKTPLDIAKQSNKEKIIQTLEEHLKKSSGQVKRLSEQEKEVHERLRKFVEDFVFIYERSLSEYYERLENKRGKPGKWSDFANNIMGIGKGGIEGTEDTKIKASSLIGIKVLQIAISGIGSHHNRAELKKLMDQLYIFKTNPIKVREELVKSGIEIFQVFESQFVQVTAGGSWQRAMTKLAEDAVSRVIDYYRKNTEKEFSAHSITNGIIFGKSKRYKQTSIGSPNIKLGHTLENKNSWNTAELFDKPGLVTIKSDGNTDKYYKRKDEKSDTSRYGYRLLFKWELENKVEKLAREYREESPPREEYRYILKSGEKENLAKEILGPIDKKEKILIEEIVESIKQISEEDFNELEDYIGKNFNELSSYIESNRKEIEEVFSELIKQHQEASQEIANSIAEGRKESRESFEQLDKKLDKIHSVVVAREANKQIREPVWFNVRKPVSLFTGRKEELIDLHNKVQRSSGKVTVISQITSISGLGGIGKTELAREYIQEHSKDYYNDVIWINAESEVSIIESFTRLAKDKLKIDTKDANGKEKDIKSIIEEVYKFFSNSKSLFIFDDAEKSNYLNKFLPLHDLLPDGNGPYVLITSRNQEWDRGIEVVNLNELKSEEAIEFVKKGLGIEDESQNEKIKVLVEKLQYFPLAIQQAIAYIEDQRVTEEFDIDDYLNEYEKKTEDLLNYEAFRGIDNDYTKTTFTTWKITTNKIASNKEYGELALSILNVISYLAPDRISREVFLGLTESGGEELRSAVRLLVKYSMVSSEQKQSIFSVHKLVQDVTRIVLEEQGKSEEVMDETFKLLETNFPDGSDKLEDYIKKRELLPHLEVFLSHVDNWLRKSPKDQQRIEKNYLENLLTLMSDAYFNSDNPQRQKELLERALPILENHYGVEHLKVARILVNLSVSDIALGDYQEAKELLEKALKIEKNHYGEEHFEVAKTLVNLGVIYRALGDHQGAKELLERALPILENHYGKDHSLVAQVLVNLSNIYTSLSDYQKAKELIERALFILGGNYGENQFQIAKTLANISIGYRDLGDYQEAKEMLEKVLPILEKHYAEKHYQVAIAQVNLGITYLSLSDYQKTKELLEKALPVLEKHYGKDHVEVAKTLVSLSVSYGALDDYQKQKECLERVLPVFESYYGAEYFEVGIILESLGMSCLILGNYEEAKELLEKALPILEKHYGKDHVEVAKALVNLSIAYQGLNNRQKQKELLEKALPILERYYGEDHPEVAIALENLGTANRALGNDQRATELLEKANKIYQKGKNLIEECFPSTSSGRNKREAKTGECELLWEDVDEFNIGKDKKRNFSKIEIDSEKFIDYIKDLPEEKRSQLIQLADKVQVKGRFNSLINKLTSNQKVMNHLNRVKKISSITMHGMMAKNILADFLNGDYQGVAINVGFIAGGQGFAKVAEAASLKGFNLLSGGKILLGRSLIAASPFLARGTSVFIVYDLVNQVKAFRNGTEGALVGIVGDSIYLGVDVAEIGIEVAEAFEVLEGVSSVTGPIGATIGAVVFVGTDVYMAVERVDKIDQIIHLTGKEKFIEGLRAFIGMQPEQYIEELMEEKQLYNQLAKQGFEYLKKHSDVQSYVFPTGKSVVGPCRKVLYPVSSCTGSICLPPSTVTRYYTEECTTKFEIDLDSKVLLNRKRTDIKWSRARPSDPSGGRLFCLPKEDDDPAPNYGSYLCENAIGLSNNKTEGYTLINLGEGEDYAKGFMDSPNIFVVNDGSKIYYGGDKNDIFILQGDLIEGYLYGEGGVNTLDLTEFALNATSVDVALLYRGIITYDGHSVLQAFRMDKILGRRAKGERVFSICDTQFIDGQGGAENNSDIIVISNDNCTYKMQIVVRPNTDVKNEAYNGEFDYIVLPEKGKAQINLSSLLRDVSTDRHNFFFNSTISELMGIYIQNTSQISNQTVKSATFNFLPADNKSKSEFDEGRFNVTISNVPINAYYTLSNGAQVKIGRKDNIYILESTKKSSEETIRDYLPTAKRLNKISFLIQSFLSSETVVIGSGNHEVIHNNPAYKSHLVGNGGENVYVIDSEVNNVPEIIIHDVDEENSIDTIDLRNVIKKAKDNFELQVIQSENDLLLRATVEKHEYFTVRLKDGVERYNKTHVIVENAPMVINFDNNQWSLKPQPLVFEKDKEIIVITDQDVEKGTELVTPRKGGNYTFVRINSNNLMITNAFDSTITRNDLCSITLSKFYEVPKMATLSIKFADKEIILKEHQEEISAARNVDSVKREYKDQVYNDVFTEVMLSDQPHRHRHEHSRQHIRNRRMVSSTTRSTSWINDLFGWVKNSIGRFRAALPEISANYSNTADRQYTSQFSSKVCISNNIGLGFFLLQSFLDKKYPLPKFCSATHEEVLSDTLNIMEKFKKTLKKTAKQSGVSVKGFDFFKVYSDIAGHVRNERYSKIPSTLYSVVEEAYPKNEKFLSIFKGSIGKMLDRQQMVNNHNQEQGIANVDPSFLLNRIVVKSVNNKGLKGVNYAGQVV